MSVGLAPSDPATIPPMATGNSTTPDLLRLTTRVASLYHERGFGQVRIAEQLGIVRITVHVPEGVHAELEQQLEERYDLDEVILVEVDDAALRDDEAMSRALASTVAAYLELMVPSFESIGVSSWSSTLLAAVNAMRPMGPGATKSVVQVLGGVGVPGAQRFATRLTERLAQLAKAEPVFMLAPGVVASPAAKKVLLADPSCREAVERCGELSAVLMGIGAIPPSRMLRESGNVFSDQDLADLKRAGAVGDVCMRFYDPQGRPVETDFDKRVIGISTDQIRRARRRIGVAGGRRKFEAIRGALRGGWLSTLITDLATGKRMLAEP